MPSRYDPLVNNHFYHIYSKGVGDLSVFPDRAAYDRMMLTLRYYKKGKPSMRLSNYLHQEVVRPRSYSTLLLPEGPRTLVTIVAYCLMPTHIHFILRQEVDEGIERYMQYVLNSYSRYYNNRYKRKGVLWCSRFQSAYIDQDEYLVHLTRYIHLNPVTAYLVNDPSEWEASSYDQYITTEKTEKSSGILCEFVPFIDPDIMNTYRQFVADRIDYQRMLAHIKSYILD